MRTVPGSSATHPDPARRRVLGWTAAVFAFLALSVFALTPPSRAVFDEKVAELRAAGYATTLEESWRDAPPAEQNAAFEIEAAWEELVEERGHPRKWGVTGPWDYAAVDPWNETAGDERLAALATSLDGIRPFFDRVETAATKPAFRVREGRDASGLPDGGGVRLLQDVHRLVEAQSLANRDPRRRLSAAVAALRLADAEGADPLLHSMVRSVYADTAVRAVRALVERADLTGAEVRGACDVPLRRRDLLCVQRAARGELWNAPELFEAYFRGDMQFCMGTPTGPFARSRIVHWVRGLSHGHDHSDPSVEECAAFLEHTRRIAEVPPCDVRALRRAVEDLDVESLGEAFQGTWTHIVQTHARRESARALARVALAAAEFREREGRWPESLDALSPMFPEGVPVDPCDGRPFEFVVADGKFRLTARGRIPGARLDPERSPRDDLLVWEFVDR